MSRIAVIGTGYVGLTTGACFAHLGHHVVCADVVPEKVERLSRGDVPILEAGLDELVRAGIDGGRLRFVLGAAAAARTGEFAYLCVQTPHEPDGSADLSFIRQAASEIGPVLPSESIVVNKSTVPVGSTRVVEDALGRSDVRVVSNPEFLREGSAVYDFLHPDRIVIGCEDPAVAGRVAALFAEIRAPVIVTDPASAETIKYASNAFLATKVSFVNAIANVCEAVGADVREVVLGMGYDKRIGFEFLKPGPGFGGSCFTGEETVLARTGGRIRLLSFTDLFAEVERVGVRGWEVLSWPRGASTPEFLPVAAFSARPYDGTVVQITTKMGRRVVCTPDHLFVVGDGLDDGVLGVELAGELTTEDWLPVAQGFPMVKEPPRVGHPLEALSDAGLSDEQVIVRLGDEQFGKVEARAHELPTDRRWEIRRHRVLRLHELRALGVPVGGGAYGTAKNGTYVPADIPLDEAFWHVVGLYLAEGHAARDGRRVRLSWSFHPTAEDDLVDFVASYWRGFGVKASVFRAPTSSQVSVSSRILSAWFTEALGLGSNCYDHRLPDLAWALSERCKRALLRGLWDGDGSWSRVANGPSVVLQYGTVSRALADGMLRLLGDLRLTARLRIGRTAKSTVDTYWITISGADQVEDALWLLPDSEAQAVRVSIAGQAKRTRPTGYRTLSKNASWVRVTSVAELAYQGQVYSVEIPDAGTVVTTHGLVAHNCFPKDSRALIRTAEDAGYDFGLLRGVIEVNEEQFERVTEKVVRLAGGSVDGQVVAAWGLTFKARTDDLRMSPALEVLRRLDQRGARLRAYDPSTGRQRGGLLDARLDGVEVCADPYAACEGAVVLVVLTEWDEFRSVDFGKVAQALAAPRIVDARNLLDPAALRRRGFTYEGIGR